MAASINKTMEIQNLPEDFPISLEKIDEMLKWYISYYKEHSVENTVLYPNVISVLESCKNKNIPMGVVSNRNKTSKPRYFFCSVAFFCGFSSFLQEVH